MIRGLTSRRQFVGLMAGGGASCWTAAVTGQMPASRPAGDPACPVCRGLGQIPLRDAKPFVFVEGSGPLKPLAALGEQWCPSCRPLGNPADLEKQVRDRLDHAEAAHAQWEERTGWKLNLVLTRHAAIHSQLTPAQTRTVGTALETLAMHLRGVTRSLALTPTWPDQYGLIYLWERPAWDRFRQVMETLYTREQLGEWWPPARDFNSFDHPDAPHVYATAQSLRQRPLAFGPLYLFARRQMTLLTAGKAPDWLLEGFGSYGQHAVTKEVRWFTIYDSSRTPPIGDWLREARQKAADNQLRPLAELVTRELRHWEQTDYFQSLALVAFLLQTEPSQFLDLASRLKNGEASADALAAAYKTPLADLDQQASRWLLAKK